MNPACLVPVPTLPLPRRLFSFPWDFPGSRLRAGTGPTWAWGGVSWSVSVRRPCLLGHNLSDFFSYFDEAFLSNGMSNLQAECQEGRGLLAGTTARRWDCPDFDWRVGRAHQFGHCPLTVEWLEVHGPPRPPPLSVSLCLCPCVFLSLPFSLSVSGSHCLSLVFFYFSAHKHVLLFHGFPKKETQTVCL